ncbi:hypothetical protein ONE63_007224 [Megalurothrips usitatus]|uniref:Uncharacterized protein n=1 Tax=Megalurothrips usitatus TaxID=439358 RepID=A0AAV7XS44_9NEOP|nr:hypothetical protein ONE63_007224 [Megalurothrips usitatus]
MVLGGDGEQDKQAVLLEVAAAASGGGPGPPVLPVCRRVAADITLLYFGAESLHLVVSGLLLGVLARSLPLHYNAVAGGFSQLQKQAGAVDRDTVRPQCSFLETSSRRKPLICG